MPEFFCRSSLESREAPYHISEKHFPRILSIFILKSWNIHIKWCTVYEPSPQCCVALLTCAPVHCRLRTVLMTKSSESAVQVTHISIVAEAVRSVEHVLSQVQNPDKLSSVCLHGNLLTSCSNFAQLSALTDLNLSANRITSVQDLGKLPQLVNLNLSSNRLVNLDGLPPLPNLSRISVAHNKLTCLSGLRALDGGCLHTADVRSNRLSELRSLAVFANMPSLRNLSISGGVSGNPVASVAGLQAAVAAALPQVTVLAQVHHGACACCTCSPQLSRLCR